MDEAGASTRQLGLWTGSFPVFLCMRRQESKGAVVIEVKVLTTRFGGRRFTMVTRRNSGLLKFGGYDKNFGGGHDLGGR